jgi:rubrerythrin
MVNVFKGSEVVEIAVRMERNGYKFYSGVQKKIKDKNANDIFQYLASEEKKHEALFSEMLARIGRIDPPASMKEDYELYVQGIAASHIFSDDKSAAIASESVQGIQDALNIGITFEKDSILFFREMQNYIPESQRKTIEKIVDEEKKHLAKLNELRSHSS